MRELLLGVDIGTSACKVAVFNREGEVIASGNGGYQVYYPHPGWAEQNPDEWWSAVCSAIGDVLKKGNVKPEEIKEVFHQIAPIAVLREYPAKLDGRINQYKQQHHEPVQGDGHSTVLIGGAFPGHAVSSRFRSKTSALVRRSSFTLNGLCQVAPEMCQFSGVPGKFGHRSATRNSRSASSQSPWGLSVRRTNSWAGAWGCSSSSQTCSCCPLQMPSGP